MGSPMRCATPQSSAASMEPEPSLSKSAKARLIAASSGSFGFERASPGSALRSSCVAVQKTH
jgi:hypothetical protein